MSKVIERKTDEFDAESDDGKTYHIIETTRITVVTDLDGNVEEMPGWKKLRTSAGHAVNFKGNDEYELVDTGAIVRQV